MSQDMSQLRFHGEEGRDEFKRAQIAEKVIALLKSDINVSPMVIDGHWGTGKTEFCFKLINEIKNEHERYKTLYINAFKADHADNPLMTILGEVLGLLPEGDQKQSFLSKAIPVARYSLQTVLKAGVGHLLRQNAEVMAEGLEKHLEESANNAIDATVATLLKDHERSEQNIQALQTCLEEISEQSPILIFIDELDRCRPDFAVKMLETVKHTFDVNGVKFVLITNSNQLRAAINHCYGGEVNAQKYLDKFLKFKFSLPEKVPSENTYKNLAAASHFRKLISESNVLKDAGILDREGVFGFVKELIEINRPSLREIETFVRHMEIYQAVIPGDGFERTLYFGVAILRIFAGYMFCMAPEVASSVLDDRADAVKIGELLGTSKLPAHDSTTSKYPSYCEITAVMLAQDCPLNSGLFQSQSNEINNLWRGYAAQSWGNRMMHEGMALTQVKEVLEALSLAK